MMQTLALIIIVFISLFAIQTGVPADAIFKTNGSFDHLIHFQSNAYLTWHTFGDNEVFLPLLFVLFISGTFLYLRHRTEATLTAAILTSVLLAVAIPLLFGRDTVLIYTLCPLPYILSAIRIKSPPSLSFLLYFLSALLLVATSQHLAPVTALVIFLLSCREDLLSRRFLFFFGLCYLGAFLLPEVVLPHYPLGASVVADDGLPGIITPYTHAAAPFQIRDTAYMRHTSERLFYLLTALFIVLLALLRERRLLLPIALLLSLIGLDIFLPEASRIIAPLDTIHRVIPGLHFYTLLPITLAVALFATSLSLARAADRDVITLSSSLLIFIFIGGQKVTIAAPKHFTRYAELVSEGIPEKLLVSPSFAVFRDYPYIPNQEVVRKTKFVSSRAIYDSFSEDTMPPEKRFHRLEDRNPHTRWTPRKGGQNGDEALLIHFKAPLVLHALRLDTGDFHSDFPRGLRILSMSKCDVTHSGLPSSGEPLKELLEIPHWKGSLRYTENGLPYYGPQSDVTLYFEPAQVQCLRIEQTGKAIYDWSIAEISYAGEFPRSVMKHKQKKKQ